MNKILIAPLSLIFSATAFATVNVQLDMKMMINGQDANSTVVTPYGKTAIVSQAEKNGNMLEVSVIPLTWDKPMPTTPTSNKDSDHADTSGSGRITAKDAKATKAPDLAKIVKLDFVITEYKGGKKTEIAKSTIYTRLGETASLKEEQKTKPKLMIEVVPTEVNVGEVKK